MATATVTRPRTSATAAASPVALEATASQKAVSALVVGAASVATLGVFVWAAWVTSQISIPI
jgi:hypothetical protein